ncbi:MAG: Panacea domain-containing protein [Gallionellaceae bacterium]
MNDIERNRLINLIIFFAENTLHCGKIKLFKLLYLLDFEHFCITGKSVTNFEYQAWKFGPVPVELMEEWEEFGADLLDKVHVEPEKIIDFTLQAVKVNQGVRFDEDNFTPRQLKLMAKLASRYKETRSPVMIDVTHEINGAWDKVWRNGVGAHQVIPYELAISDDAPARAELLSIASEQAMYRAALQAERRLATA